ncbi:hypothetical protein PoB_001106100 [Plakobranchus ocellatus]|uniref:15-oxoprostaglandin 13-reductase n=1 Tax=Plakobranchus ocellatus TaxID=259542 RepID=A0AAV3YMP8_9GAST|nr:hypothetical protein PoB_001106100 [Plakobranchus ocellatus]
MLHNDCSWWIHAGKSALHCAFHSVVASRYADLRPGALVICAAGWRTHSVIKADATPVQIVKELGDFPASVCLGPLGLPGLTAYFGLMEICNPKPGNIVLVNAAAGAINSIVGQIAKIKGCQVIAFASSRERCNWIRELGFDYVYYKSVTVSAALTHQAHHGVDFFFDCVGADFTKAAVRHMKPDGTICMFGSNSCYGRHIETERRNEPYRIVYMRNGKVCSISIHDFKDKFDEALAQLLNWMNQGKLRYSENIFGGFEKLPEALRSLYDDTTVGSVRVSSSKAESRISADNNTTSLSS